MSAEKMRKRERAGHELYRPHAWGQPFERMEEMFNEYLRRPLLRSRWSDFPHMFSGEEPVLSVDIYEEGNNVILKSDLPGMTSDDIEITLTEDSITVSGEKKKEEKMEKEDYYYVERSYGYFSRTLHFPVEVKEDEARASFKDGVLEVTIPKADVTKKTGRKIKVE